MTFIVINNLGVVLLEFYSGQRFDEIANSITLLYFFFSPLFACQFPVCVNDLCASFTFQSGFRSYAKLFGFKNRWKSYRSIVYSINSNWHIFERKFNNMKQNRNGNVLLLSTYIRHAVHLSKHHITSMEKTTNLTRMPLRESNVSFFFIVVVVKYFWNELQLKLH